jgi:alanyl-tRNA synthetase
VNEHVWANLPVTTREQSYQEAIAAGAMAFFTEKYGDMVRVVDVPGVSLELCGGTHVGTTGEIALFRFTHETGSQAGVRRIEAITGPAAYRLARDLERRLDDASAVLKTRPEHLVHRLESLLEENRKLAKRVADLLRAGAAGSSEPGTIERIGAVELHVDVADLEDRHQIALTMDAFRERHRQAIRVLFTNGARPGIHVAVTDDWWRERRKPACGGTGGGRRQTHFARGVGDAEKLPEARRRAAEIVRGLLER